MIRYYCNLRLPLINDFGNPQTADSHFGAGLFAAVIRPLFAGNLRQLGKRRKGERGREGQFAFRASRRGRRSSHLTLEVGVLRPGRLCSE
jgi:hypothetical protein